MGFIFWKDRVCFFALPMFKLIKPTFCFKNCSRLMVQFSIIKFYLNNGVTNDKYAKKNQ